MSAVAPKAGFPPGGTKPWTSSDANRVLARAQPTAAAHSQTGTRSTWSEFVSNAPPRRRVAGICHCPATAALNPSLTVPAQGGRDNGLGHRYHRCHDNGPPAAAGGPLDVWNGAFESLLTVGRLDRARRAFAVGDLRPVFI